MLGSNLFVHIYGTISTDGIYSGYSENSGKGFFKHDSAIVFSHNKIEESISGIVIATIICTNGSIKPIVAPVGEIYYEPEIREKLKNVRWLKYKKLTCLYEKSCGAVVFYRNKGTVEVLLVKNRNGKYWSFPKGHIEKGENEHSTAVREIKEETGLDVTIYDHYRQTSDYVPFGKIRKRVVFFLAEAKNNNVHIQQDEIDSYTWVTFEEAQKMCRYDNDIRVLTTAKQAICRHDNNEDGKQEDL